MADDAALRSRRSVWRLAQASLMNLTDKAAITCHPSSAAADAAHGTVRIDRLVPALLEGGQGRSYFRGRGISGRPMKTPGVLARASMAATERHATRPSSRQEPRRSVHGDADPPHAARQDTTASSIASMAVATACRECFQTHIF